MFTVIPTGALHRAMLAATPRKPRPHVSLVTGDRDAIIEAQRARLRDIEAWAQRQQGPCSECRWRQGSGGYEWCMNPAVIKGTTDPVKGDVAWEGPPCRHERSADEYPERYGERWADHPPLCGPDGLLFEPRTYGQFIGRWLLGGLNLLWIIPVAGFIIAVFVNAILPSLHG